MSADVDPAFSSDDLAYVRCDYLTLEQLCAERSEDPAEVRRLVDERRLPQPSYVLPDGSEMYPPDYFELLDAAGGVDALAGWFADRHRAATSALGAPGVDPDEDWQGYLSGQFGVCLREVSPEAMVEKNALIAEIDSLTAVPATEDEGWRASLREAVDALDEIERPFTDYDRQRWGGTSRDSHITTVRAKYLTS
jgi:hypothetical protein